MEKLLISIASQINNNLHKCSSPGLLIGLSGISIFLAEYKQWIAGRAGTHDGVSDYHAILSKIIRQINSGFNFPAHASGLSGIAWTFAYLGDRGFISKDEATLFDPILPGLSKWALDEAQKDNPDVLHGALGVSLLHGEDPKSQTQVIDEILKRIDTDNIDFGLAHGLPGYLVAMLEGLQNIHEKNTTGQARIKEIIQLTHFIINQADWNMTEGSVFPTKFSKGKSNYPSRLAWCYGDAGIGAGLLRITELLKKIAIDFDEEFEHFTKVGIRVLELAAKRQSSADTRISDPFFCHGSSGLALIFFKAWLISKNDRLRVAWQYWHQQTVNYLPEVLASMNRNPDPRKLCLLEGISGIGLVLLAIEQVELPGWENGLMI